MNLAFGGNYVDLDCCHCLFAARGRSYVTFLFAARGRSYVKFFAFSTASSMVPTM